MRLFYFLLLLPNLIWSQNSGLSIFEPLMNKTWNAEGNWGDGSNFKQTLKFSYILDGTLVLAEGDGYTDANRTEFGPRNHGIRKVDPASGNVVFTEYDVFGGITNGQVFSEGKNIRYVYEYGGTIITDFWEYVNDDTYNFTVGTFDDGDWKQVYLKTQFSSAPLSNTEKAFIMMREKIAGSWISPAWDGQMNEEWGTDENGHIVQTAEYEENGVVSYRAKNKIEYTSDELILFTVIEGNNPKIFKATEFGDDKVVFKNTEYDYPSTIIYTFNAEGNFSRKIEGSPESGQSDYSFHFKRTN